MEFLQQSAGKWFAQRTSHYVEEQQSESGQSNILAELLPQDSPAIVSLCQRHKIDPTSVPGGLRITLERAKPSDKVPLVGATVLVPIADPEQPSQGKVLRQNDKSEHPLTTSQYVLDSDDVLTLTTTDGSMQSEERLWFASENLRMRTSILKQDNGFEVTSFFSEIRIGKVQPAA